MIRYDWSEKPAFVALKNLMNLLKDAGSAFTPGSLSYSISGGNANLHRSLLQKRDGRFYLILWQEVSSYDNPNQRDITVPTQRVTINLNAQFRKATTYLPSVQAGQVAQYTDPRQLTVDVPDHALVIELAP